MDTYTIVRDAILHNHTWKSGKVAHHLGLDKTMGHDAATDYVRGVRRKMREDGDLIMPPELPKYAPPEERLADLTTLFEMREYNIPKKVVKNMLLCMCYWTMRCKGNFQAVEETMAANDRLKRPLPFPEIEQICNTAQDYGFDAMDEEKNQEAQKNGFPDAGLNWTSGSLYYKFMVADEELPHLKTIGKPWDKTQPWGIPNPERKE